MLKISIVTPSYNQGRFLGRTLRSVVEQDYPNIEHIVIDGGSTDDSVEIIRAHQARLAYWVSEPDRGQSHAINKGLSRCTGDLVTWLNSDDTLLPGALQRVAEAAEWRLDRNFFFGNIQFIDAKDRVLGGRPFVPCSAAHVLVVGMVFPQAGTFWRKELTDKLGLLDESLTYTMDYELFCRMAPLSRYHYINAALATYRLHDASKTCTKAFQEIGQVEGAEVRRRYRDALYTPGRLRWLRPLLNADRLLKHLARLRFGYLLERTLVRLGRKPAHGM